MSELQPMPPRLVLFDGVCGLCDRTVQWLLDRDPSGKLSFAPLQGEAAATLRARHPSIPVELETVVYVERVGDTERVYLRSRAVFAMLAVIGGPWRVVSWFAVLPAFLTDLLYWPVAATRYRIFGKRDACRLPRPEERARFLD